MCDTIETLQAIYDSEINVQLSTFWDGGVNWKLGDEWNGFVEVGDADTWKEAVEQIADAARRHYPGSVFARAKSADPGLSSQALRLASREPALYRAGRE